MNIRVKINANLRPYVTNLSQLPQGETWELSEGATINDILKMMTFPEGPKVMALLNNMLTKDWDKPLKDGDKVLFTPLAGGGSNL
jgi:molybdopterin converting factor small subunit